MPYMDCGDSKLAGLEEKYCLRILTCVLAEGPIYKSVLYTKISKTISVPMKRVDYLVEINLLKETVSERPPRSKLIELTPKGRQVAEKLAVIEKILEG